MSIETWRFREFNYFSETNRITEEMRMMNDFYEKAGLRIRELRESKRYTREKFSELVDISPKFLYEIETGQKGFSADTLHRIASGLSVTSEYILSGSKPHVVSEEVKNILSQFNDSQSEKVCELLKVVIELSNG